MLKIYGLLDGNSLDLRHIPVFKVSSLRRGILDRWVFLSVLVVSKWVYLWVGILRRRVLVLVGVIVSTGVDIICHAT